MMTVAAPGLERRLRAELRGEVLFDRASRGRYSTDASHYQQFPIGVVVPKSMSEAERVIAICMQEKIPLTARGGGTSQCGQAINRGLILDCSRYLTQILELDVKDRRCEVEPGIVLDDLNRQLVPHGLWFPIDVSTAARATIGGMTANNSCGGRSLRYGTMRDNVLSIDAILASGQQAHFGRLASDDDCLPDGSPSRPLIRTLLSIGARSAAEVESRFPKVQRRVGGYNLDALLPARTHNLAHLLVGSEGTLAFSTKIELKLSPLMGGRVLGVCHFGNFRAAMEATQHLVGLNPIAIELVDRVMLELAAENPIYQPVLRQFVRGTPEALLLVEFSEPGNANDRRLRELTEMMGDLGFSWEGTHENWGGVIEIASPAVQGAIAEVRTSGLNIMMSMKGAGKPISFIEDCAVHLEDLAEYTDGLTHLFQKHGTRGTWYGHASVGCLHVRPILNLQRDSDVRKMRAIAEEAFEMVRRYKGSHSGEHGDGLLRSEFHAAMFGAPIVRSFEEIKEAFDPLGLFNPNRIVYAPKFDERTLFRYGPNYQPIDHQVRLDWSSYSGKSGGLQGAVEMCNNNGLCRKLEGGTMCPSYRVTRSEKDVTRGRANTLRLALSGQLGADAFTSDDMLGAMALCVSCKACRKECPTGVDMARMKIEVLAARADRYGISLRDRLIGWMPRYAPYAASFPWLFNLRDRLPGLAVLSEKLVGLSADRRLPRWRRDIFSDDPNTHGVAGGKEVVLFVDTFNRYFEPENIEAAIEVLVTAGYRVHVAAPPRMDRRPLCCGRTFLSVGQVGEAKKEAKRTLAALRPFADRGMPVICLEPSCLFSFRDEIPAYLPADCTREISQQALTFEEFVACEARAGRLNLPLAKLSEKKALLHGHCHQKSFSAMKFSEEALNLVPDLEVEVLDSGCCGMAGAFGYRDDTIRVSRSMGELALLPAVRSADANTLIVADGISCRQQIRDGTLRTPIHVAAVLCKSIKCSRDVRVSEAAFEQ